MKEFIDKTSERNGTNINRDALMALQDYQNEDVIFGDNFIKKTNSQGHVETTIFGENQITRTFEGEKTISQIITFIENGYTRRLI